MASSTIELSVELLSTVSIHIADNFRRVLIFIIFVVDLAVTKFYHPRKLLMPKIDRVVVSSPGKGSGDI